MTPTDLAATYVTDKIAEARAFYEEHFDAKASFDCGWYVVLKLGGEASGREIGFMEPRDGATPYAGGTMLNLTFSDVDAVYAKVRASDIVLAMPLENHPWGDRGFGIVDPLGTMVYCLTPIEPSEEFKTFHIQLS